MILGPYYFKESYLFFNSSLYSLVDQIKMSKEAREEKFDIILNSTLCKGEEDVNYEKYDLLTAKATLPIEHLKNMSSLEERFPYHCTFIVPWEGENITEKTYKKMYHIYKKKISMGIWEILWKCTHM